MVNRNVPPYSNTGVQRTGRSGLRACVDWVQATFKNVELYTLIVDVLKLKYDAFYDAPTGSMGYRKCKKYGNISVFHDGTEEMGIHLQMSGQGCREYESFNRSTWKQLFFDFFCYKANFTRLDIAVDDFEGYFKISSIERKIKERLLISKFKDSIHMEKVNIESGKSRGKTVYYGSSQSNVQIRMYEKNYERADKGNGDGGEFWNRTEIQTRDERAQKVAELIMVNDDNEETVGQIVAGILKYYLRFIVKGNDSNRRRWKTAPFWDKFLGDVEALRLTTVAPDRTVEKTVNWIGNQVAPSLAILFETFGNDMDIIKQFVDEGRERLTEKEYNMIADFKSKREKAHSVE